MMQFFFHFTDKYVNASQFRMIHLFTELTPNEKKKTNNH